MFSPSRRLSHPSVRDSRSSQRAGGRVRFGRGPSAGRAKPGNVARACPSRPGMRPLSLGRDPAKAWGRRRKAKFVAPSPDRSPRLPPLPPPPPLPSCCYRRACGGTGCVRGAGCRGRGKLISSRFLIIPLSAYKGEKIRHPAHVLATS